MVEGGMDRLAADTGPVVAPPHLQADPGDPPALRGGAGQLAGPQVPAQRRRGTTARGRAFEAAAGTFGGADGAEYRLVGVRQAEMNGCWRF